MSFAIALSTVCVPMQITRRLFKSPTSFLRLPCGAKTFLEIPRQMQLETCTAIGKNSCFGVPARLSMELICNRSQEDVEEGCAVGTTCDNVCRRSGTLSARAPHSVQQTPTLARIESQHLAEQEAEEAMGREGNSAYQYRLQKFLNK
eukprot:3545910-Amphidinium_carterae.1